MLDFIKKIRENLKDPKKKALTKLGLYALFFTFVILLFSNTSKLNTTPVPTPKKEVKDISYNYTIDINENNVLTHITGYYSKDNETFTCNDVEYKIIDNTVYLKDSLALVDFKYNISNYYYKTIEELLKKSEFIKKTEYNSGEIDATYTIKVDKYYNECVNNCDNDIVINTHENEHIESIFIDFTNVNNYIYTVSIKYENIESK